MSAHAPINLAGTTASAPRLVSALRHLGAPRAPRADQSAPLVAAVIPADQVPAGATVLGTFRLGPGGLGEAAGVSADPFDAAPPFDEESLAPSADGPVQVDLASRTVLVSGRALTLTRLEFDLLALLVATPRRVHTRTQLHASVWEGISSGGPRTVDVHVHRLRYKLGPVYEQHLATVRGVGYRWDPNPEPRRQRPGPRAIRP